MAVFYPAFDICIIDANGFRVELGSETVDVYNVTAGSSLGTLTSNSDGFVVEGSFVATAGDVIEISSGSYPLTCRFVLTATQEEAYTLAENDVNTYIAENLYVATTDVKTAALYLTDLDNPDVPPVYLGSGRAGETNSFPLQTSVPKNYRITMFPQDENFQVKGTDFSTAESFDIAVPAATGGPVCIFDHFTDATTADGTLYLDQIDAGRLATNGNKIVVEYSGVFAANTDSKILTLIFAGTTIFHSSDIYESSSHWKMNATIIRVSNTVVRSVVHFETSVPWTPVYTEITSLNLTTTDYDLDLYALVDGSDPITAKMGYGMFIPAETINTTNLMLFGETVTFGGQPVTFAGGDIPGTMLSFFGSTLTFEGSPVSFIT